MAAARVLVIDDNQLYLAALDKMLHRGGYQVLQATDARRALELIRNEPLIDVVLSDVMMPGMPGTDLAREVALISPQTAVVLMTGGVISSAAVPNDTTLLKKPFSMQDLFAAVQTAVVRSTQLRAMLASELEKVAGLQQHSKQLILELEKVHRDAAETCRKSRLLGDTEHEN
jgi:DNA-binding NtrC family response regulator